jgi:hypothetical protein
LLILIIGIGKPSTSSFLSKCFNIEVSICTCDDSNADTFDDDQMLVVSSSASVVTSYNIIAFPFACNLPAVAPPLMWQPPKNS